MHDRTPAPRQNDLICAPWLEITEAPPAVPNGGFADALDVCAAAERDSARQHGGLPGTWRGCQLSAVSKRGECAGQRAPGRFGQRGQAGCGPGQRPGAGVPAGWWGPGRV